MIDFLMRRSLYSFVVMEPLGPSLGILRRIAERIGRNIDHDVCRGFRSR
jgi:hypothetical protein